MAGRFERSSSCPGAQRIVFGLGLRGANPSEHIGNNGGDIDEGGQGLVSARLKCHPRTGIAALGTDVRQFSEEPYSISRSLSECEDQSVSPSNGQGSAPFTNHVVSQWIRVFKFQCAWASDSDTGLHRDFRYGTEWTRRNETKPNNSQGDTEDSGRWVDQFSEQEAKQLLLVGYTDAT